MLKLLPGLVGRRSHRDRRGGHFAIFAAHGGLVLRLDRNPLVNFLARIDLTIWSGLIGATLRRAGLLFIIDFLD